MSTTGEIGWPGWKTVRLIGQGSFGAVYEIERKLFDDDEYAERAALKVISIPQNSSDIDEMYSDGYDEESITSTFQSHLKSIVAEYSLMRKMNGCANVVNCDDVRYIQHDDGLGWDIFIKMELLTPLAQSLPSVIPEEMVIKLGMDICRALVVCKKYDIVHRDIKPQNIFISDNGDYKLGDFGIAKTVERTTGGTKTGTYKYMAPEVYNNEPYGSAADIYSLGLVLYWMLNERRMPFMPLPPEKLKSGMDELARRRRFAGEPIPAPKNGSAELKAVVLKACAFDPAERYQTAKEMQSALEQIGKGAAWQEEEDETVVSAAVPVMPRKQKRVPAPPTQEDEATIYGASVLENNSWDENEEEGSVFGLGYNSIPQKEKKQIIKGAVVGGLTALVLVLIFTVVTFIVRSANKLDESGVSETQQETETIAGYTETTDAEQFDATVDNGHAMETATAEETVETKDTWRDNTIVVNWRQNPVTREVIDKSNILSVTFLGTLADAPDTSWDISTKRDGSVRAWAVKNGDCYDMYIAAEGGINAESRCANMFKDCTNLRAIAFDGNFYTEDVTDMAGMFCNCRSLETLDLSNFDTSEVTQMSNMFAYCKSLVTLDLSSFDTSKVTGMSNLFFYCESLETLDLSSFDTSEVTHMSNMFTYCKSLETLDLSSFDTSNVEGMSGMFQYCEKLVTLDLSNFDTSEVSNMISMFYDCKSLETLNLSSFDTAKVTNMTAMFRGCESLTKLNVSSFDTSKVSYMGNMFCGCENLTALDLSHFDTSQVTIMEKMFYDCGRLITLILGDFDTSNVKKYYNFANGDYIASIYWKDLFED